MLARIALIALLLVPLLEGLTAAQTQQAAETEEPSFKAGTSLVSLEVTVTDKKGRPIDGLTRGDFKVYEDGKLLRGATRGCPLRFADHADGSGLRRGLSKCGG